VEVTPAELPDEGIRTGPPRCTRHHLEGRQASEVKVGTKAGCGVTGKIIVTIPVLGNAIR
jgi:hypothetical protein